MYTCGKVYFVFLEILKFCVKIFNPIWSQFTYDNDKVKQMNSLVSKVSSKFHFVVDRWVPNIGT
jgi:hypothetical protein